LLSVTVHLSRRNVSVSSGFVFNLINTQFSIRKSVVINIGKIMADYIKKWL
jgi:hypothetical protein